MLLTAKIQAPPKTLNLLNKLGLLTYLDLLLHIPLRYQNLSQIYSIKEAPINQEVLLEGVITKHNLSTTKKGRMLEISLQDNSGNIKLIFFNFYQNMQYSTYAINKLVRVFGKIELDLWGNKTIMHPAAYSLNSKLTLKPYLYPVYPKTLGLNNQKIIELVDLALNCSDLKETLPESIIKNYNLLSLKETLGLIHHLPVDGSLKPAIYRLKLEELLSQQLIMLKLYTAKKKNLAPLIKASGKYLNPLFKSLSFQLTEAQQKVVKEILVDLSTNQQMNRLLQGDVGSGKTIVATIAALATIEADFQAIIMAPTEILAEQHYNKIKQLLAFSDLKISYLVGSLSSREKALIYSEIEEGISQLIIGTHALIQEKVQTLKPGLVIIDEQHRFGVLQRSELVRSTNKVTFPHLLTMSATPIPRSLAMSYYADLDLSVIDELPRGRQAIETILINQNRRLEVISFVREHLLRGEQAYWVCPLIEESEKLNLENAENIFKQLSLELTPYKIGLLHGKMRALDKTQIMHDFIHNKINLLVATTVIEVGVDVPNASIMVIEHAERMGLASLHQLRGRVGRGSKKSSCVLLFNQALSHEGKARLKAINDTTDGFEIAKADLLIRGPGELLGERQSGLPMLKFANLEEDIGILKLAKSLALELNQSYPEYIPHLIKFWVEEKLNWITS